MAGDRDFLVYEDHVIDILEVFTGEVEVFEVTDAPPGEKGDPGPPGPMGPMPDIYFSHRGTVTVHHSGMKYRFSRDAVILGVSAALGQPPTGSDLTFDVLVNDMVVASLTVFDGSDDMPEVPLAIPVLMGDCATVRVTGVGSINPGDDLSIFIRQGV